jgi:hypothetical protein
MICVKYSMAFLNLLELGTIYFLLGFTFKMNARTKNLIILLFSFNPLFNGFESYAVDESFAIIFFPLVLALMLGQEKLKGTARRSVIAILLFLLVAIVLSHHFTSYMVAFSLITPPTVLYLLRKDFVKTWRLVLLSLVLPLSWAAFTAYPVFLQQLNDVWQIITRLTSVRSLVGYSYSAVNESSGYYPTNLSKEISLIWTGLSVVLALIGLISFSSASNKRALNHFRVLLIAYGILSVGLLYFVDWRGITAQGIVLSDIRDRIIGFSYLFISFFAALGMLTIMRKAPKWPKSKFWRGSTKLLIGGSFIVLVTIAFVFATFDREMYDTTYSPISIGDESVAPVQEYALGLWVLHSISPVSSENIVFTGSSSAENYVIGYGLFNGTWDTSLYPNISSTSMNNITQLFYVVNTYNYLLPDPSGIKLNSSTTQFLENSFSKVYDNGVIYVCEHNGS